MGWSGGLSGLCLIFGCLTLMLVQILSTPSLLEREKRRHYEEQVHDVERAAFVPLVFIAPGGQGNTAMSFYKLLGLMVSEKSNE